MIITASSAALSLLHYANFGNGSFYSYHLSFLLLFTDFENHFSLLLLLPTVSKKLIVPLLLSLGKSLKVKMVRGEIKRRRRRRRGLLMCLW